MNTRSIHLKHRIVNGKPIVTDFPLPPNYFNLSELTKTQQYEYIAQAKTAFHELITVSKRHGGPTKWKPLVIQNGAEICHQAKSKKKRSSTRLRHDSMQSNASETSSVCSSTTLEEDGVLLNDAEGVVSACAFSSCEGSLEEIVQLYNGDTTEQVRQWAKELTEDVIDAMHLYTLEERSEDQMNYIGIKWAAGASPTRLFSDRDHVYLECQMEFIDEYGMRCWGRCTQSVELPGVPHLTEFGMVRAELHNCGLVFRETKQRGLLQCSYYMKWNPKGKMPKWLLKAGMIRRVAGINLTDAYMKNRRFAEQTYLTKSQLVPKKLRKHCSVCEAKFIFVMTRKYGCRKCGEVVCSSCNKAWKVNIPKVGVCNIRICTKCFIGIRSDKRENPTFLE